MEPNPRFFLDASWFLAPEVSFGVFIPYRGQAKLLNDGLPVVALDTFEWFSRYSVPSSRFALRLRRWHRGRWKNLRHRVNREDLIRTLYAKILTDVWGFLSLYSRTLPLETAMFRRASLKPRALLSAAVGLPVAGAWGECRRSQLSCLLERHHFTRRV